MASRSLNDLCPEMKDLCSKFLVQCLAEGINAFVTCTYRSSAEQDADYSQGRSRAGAVITNAKGGESAHNCVDLQGLPAARAFDFAIKTTEGSLDWNASDAQWQRAIHIGQSLGLVSGSNWRMKDNPHFELFNWKTMPTS